jgi:hypothetical protein
VLAYLQRFFPLAFLVLEIAALTADAIAPIAELVLEPVFFFTDFFAAFAVVLAAAFAAFAVVLAAFFSALAAAFAVFFADFAVDFSTDFFAAFAIAAETPIISPFR